MRSVCTGRVPVRLPTKKAVSLQTQPPQRWRLAIVVQSLDLLDVVTSELHDVRCGRVDSLCPFSFNMTDNAWKYSKPDMTRCIMYLAERFAVCLCIESPSRYIPQPLRDEERQRIGHYDLP